MKPEQFLASHWVFTRKELELVPQERGSRSKGTVSSHLTRWRQQGRILKVKEGLYVRTEPTKGSGVQSLDLLPLASKMAPDAALAYHTALEAHGLAQSLFERIAFVTWTKTKPLRFQGRDFVPVRPREALKRSGKADGWIESMERSGVEIRVTSLERTVVDVFDRPDLAGGAEEVWRSCMGVPALDLREVEAYLKILARRALVARVGFFLEQRVEELAVPRSLLERLRNRIPRSIAYFDRRIRGHLAPGWNLIVPETWITPPEGQQR